MPLYSSLVMKMDKSTAHSTAQEIGNTAIIPIFDDVISTDSRVIATCWGVAGIDFEPETVG